MRAFPTHDEAIKLTARPGYDGTGRYEKCMKNGDFHEDPRDNNREDA
jgi:hypothetical protein